MLVRIGIVGCGNISRIYLKNIFELFGDLKAVACADLDLERAAAVASEFEGVRACTVSELMSDPDIDIVLNLTIPAAHAEISLAALAAGKHVYSEKPLAITREDGRRIMQAAAVAGLRVGCAPDTFMGAGLQTCRKLIDDGAIGTPVAATAFMSGHGPESWHPDPEFFYQIGAGPMFDMGPYYLTALISLIGPVRRVTASARITFQQRTITSQPKEGTLIDVRTPTHIAGLMDFAGGAVGSIITSFDIWGAKLPRIEIYGSEGTLSVPDPNTFGGPVSIFRAAAKEWEEVPLTHTYAANGRGLGLADMAAAISEGRAHRACGAMAYHVLDIMQAFHDASRDNSHLFLGEGCRRPEALPCEVAEA